jgi:hypothetical protein
MAAEANAVEQAVSRTLRDNLDRIQRTAEELNQSISDLVSACASSRATNALPPMVRAQASAAALSATLEVLSRFVTSAMQPPLRPFELEPLRLTPPSASDFSFGSTLTAERPLATGLASPALEPSALEPPPPALQHPTEKEIWAAPPALETRPAYELTKMEAQAPIAPANRYPVSTFMREQAPRMDATPPLEPFSVVEPPPAEFAVSEAEPAFDLASLPLDEQELHRRAYRVAKVSMQDIKLLRPDDVRAGREHNDLCIRLRDDIEKAHKEYDRRFQAIQSHPVDYFYDWMVEILGGGNAQALGEYPYHSPVLHR